MFTEEDLNTLKDIQRRFCGHCDRNYISEPCTCLDKDYELQKLLPALIKRLEAAEKVVEQDAKHSPNDPDILAWRKSCGKVQP